MSYSARVLADSKAKYTNERLTTLEVIFPRFILAEFNTHRVFSRNSASSRAIPPEKQIEHVLENPFVPVFGARVRGMGQGPILPPAEQEAAQDEWRRSLAAAVRSARKLVKANADKSHINRLLEPFMWHTCIVSATEWRNFFALRTDSAAQGEFQTIAVEIRRAMNASTPVERGSGSWHLPLVNDYERSILNEATLKAVSASRCARVSWDKHMEPEGLPDTLARHGNLRDSGHLSPFEHQATPPPYPSQGRLSNFRGWNQYRSEIPNQACFAR